MHNKRRSRGATGQKGFIVAIAILVLISALPLAGLAQPESAAELSQTRYFAETGHNLGDPFLERWELAGGVDVLGMPISEEGFQEEVGVSQSFETVSLVFDPGKDVPYDIQGAPLPADYLAQAAPSSARKRVDGCATDAVFCQYFPETGHSVSGRFVSFWSVSGELPILGKPVSEPFRDEKAKATVQLFQNAIIEDRGAKGMHLRNSALALAKDSGATSTLAFLPAPPTAGSTKLVSADDGLRMRSGPDLDSEVIAVLTDNAEFITPRGAKGEWLPGYADGYSGWVSAEFLKESPPLPKLDLSQWDQSVWQGAALSETNVRSAPGTSGAITQVLETGDPVIVVDWVEGEEVFTGANEWAKLKSGDYVYARNISRTAPVAAPELPADAPTEGSWIDVNLTQQLMVAYEDQKPVRVIETATGIAGWKTPVGQFSILVRVPNETMTSDAIGAEGHYRLDDVLFTQYFTDEGHAIHYAWWRTPETIGRPGSHGCLNVLFDDAQFLWDWAGIGTQIVVHY